MSLIDQLAEDLARLPGIGPKTALRLVFHLLKGSPDDARRLARSIRDVADRIRPCARCGSFTEHDLCSVCTDARRDPAVLCVVEEAYEVGAEFREQFLAKEPDSAAFFLTDEGSGEPHFDLPAYVADRLARAGVGTIADLGLCTYCEETRLFSYRRSQHHGENDYGRQISAILLT